MDPVARSAAQCLAQQAHVATDLGHNLLQILSDNRHSVQQVEENGPALSLVEVTAPPLQPQATPEPEEVCIRYYSSCFLF